MQVRTTAIEGLLTIEPDIYRDGRGYFLEQYAKRKYRDIEGFGEFVQDNCSCSRYGAIRGLHYQVGDYAQGKLVYVPYGKVLDVAVDIRFGSPTFGQHMALELSGENGCQVWLPPGLAHGFSVLSETAVFMYKCTAYYSKEHERCIRFDDPDLAIDWQVANPIVSDKDLAAPRLCSIEEDFVFPC
jgi:dTDP-4-dehydrorhamnose 3,5-epimerase